MQIRISTKRVIQTALFVAVVLVVMSFTFILQAHDVPVAQPLVAADGVATTVVEDTKPTPLSLEDVPDGLASWYGKAFHGRRTASGRRYDMYEFTAAHRSLPFGTLIRVENSSTGKSIWVEVTDRGPFVRKRVVDLSYAAAQALGVSVTPVAVGALTPSAIKGFYEGNDSTVLALDSNLNPIALSIDKLSSEMELASLKSAMKVNTDSNLIVIRPSTEGTRYFQATLAN